MKWGNEKLDMGLDLRNKKFENISILISNILTHFPRLITSLLFILMLGASLSLAAEPIYPNYIGYVNDFAGVLDSATFNKIDRICKNLKALNGDELAVVTVKTSSPIDSKSYAVALFKKWGIGQKGKDNGILIILFSEDRRVEIEVGYGLEGTINDAKAGQILDTDVVPFFKEGDFAQGLLSGAGSIAHHLGLSNPDISKSEETRSTKAVSLSLKSEDIWDDPKWGTISTVAIGVGLVLFAVVPGVFIGGAIGLALFAFIGSYFFSQVGAYIGGALGLILGIIFGFKFLNWIQFGETHGSGRSGGSSSSGSSGGSSSFGGGSSGGGGAGRSF